MNAIDKSDVRDAATVILLRQTADGPAALMGQRGKNAAFMPGKFVFPGGAIDPSDADVPVVPLNTLDETRLAEDSDVAPQVIAATAIRELWEETGQMLGTPASWSSAPVGWREFATKGHQPNGAALEFIFRAVTPKGRSRRFDARFFLADAKALVTDPDDFSRAEDELSHLQWIPLTKVRNFDLPFITKVVLAELSERIARQEPLKSVPFFQNNDERHLIARLGNKAVF